jgi:hypothetical protein
VSNLKIHVEIREIREIRVLASPMRIHIFIKSFTVNDQEQSQTNSAVHSVDTKNMHHLHRAVAILSYSQKIVYYTTSTFSAIFSLVSEVV